MPGWKTEISPLILAALCELYRPPDHASVLRDCISFFRNRAVIVPEGLETIPPCWLRSLPEVFWSTRKPHWRSLPYWMTHCAFKDGVLLMRFEQEGSGSSNELTAWDRLRIEINYTLSPNLWTPLTPEEERKIWNNHVDLRFDLFTVGSWS